jgi:hypothetical protein
VPRVFREDVIDDAFGLAQVSGVGDRQRPRQGFALRDYGCAGLFGHPGLRFHLQLKSDSLASDGANQQSVAFRRSYHIVAAGLLLYYGKTPASLPGVDEPPAIPGDQGRKLRCSRKLAVHWPSLAKV